MADSSTVDELLNLVGRGRIDISCATDIARAVMKDGVSSEKIDKLSSLGNYGLSQSNCERDLHTWLKNLFGLRVQPYKIFIDLKALVLGNKANHQINLFSNTATLLKSHIFLLFIL